MMTYQFYQTTRHQSLIPTLSQHLYNQSTDTQEMNEPLSGYQFGGGMVGRCRTNKDSSFAIKYFKHTNNTRMINHFHDGYLFLYLLTHLFLFNLILIHHFDGHWSTWAYCCIHCILHPTPHTPTPIILYPSSLTIVVVRHSYYSMMRWVRIASGYANLLAISTFTKCSSKSIFADLLNCWSTTCTSSRYCSCTRCTLACYCSYRATHLG
jgi:hypothetical protein